jgi:hypothetical protein
VKKLAAGLVLAVLVVGGLLAGLATRSGDAVLATEPLAGDPQAQAEDPAAAAKRLEKQLADLQKQRELLDAMMADLQAEKKRLDEAKKAKAAAVELGDDIAVMVAKGSKSPQFTIREVVNGKVGEMRCSDLDVLTKYLTRAFNDPKGPKKLRVRADLNIPQSQLKDVFAACAAAGYKKASFSQPQSVFITPNSTILGTTNLANQGILSGTSGLTNNTWLNGNPVHLSGLPLTNTTFGPVRMHDSLKEIDLTKYAPKKP